jgi:predicted nucleic acid-binding protein
VKVFLDTNVVIFEVEQPPIWGLRARTRITAARAAGDRLALTDLVRMECLVQPLRRGDAALVAAFAAFCALPDVDVLPITPVLCDRAAQIRATHGYQALDSLHLAAAVEHGCGLFLTNDARLAAFPDVPVEILA